MKSNVSHAQPKSDNSLATSVIGNSPAVVSPVSDDFIELARRELSKNQLVHSIQIVSET